MSRSKKRLREISPLSMSIFLSNSLGSDRPVDLYRSINTILYSQEDIVKRSAPLQYKYKQDNIPATIARAIFDNEKENKESRMHYRKIKYRVEQLLHHPLSDRQLGKNLLIMENEELVHRDDPTGKRGSKVHFSLLDKGKRKYGLRIIGTNIEVERRRKLYNLLIFFEVYKRRPLLTQRQLSNFLKVIGSSLNEFERVQEIKQPYHIPGTISKCVKGVDILGLPQHDPRTKSNKMLYYAVIPGFSVEEFMTYQGLLRKGREPTPFSSSRTIIPFILHTTFIKKEVEEAIASFKESGLITSIDPIIPGENRYNFADETIRCLAFAIWLVRTLDYELMIARLSLHRPTDNDKKYLEKYLSHRLADKMIANAYHIRKSHQISKIEVEQAIKEMEEHRRNLVQEIYSKFEKVIQENEIVRDIMEEICFSPL